MSAATPVPLPSPAVAGIRTRRRFVVPAVLFLAVLAFTVLSWENFSSARIYGVFMLGVIGIKLFLSFLPPRRFRRGTEKLTSTIVVTTYNEDPALLRACLGSIFTQTRVPDNVVVIDDCSDDLASYDLARELSEHYAALSVVRHEVNQGKREALATGFRMFEGATDVFICVDSDTILEPHALERGMERFQDPKIMAATGVVVVQNYESNALTRMIDLRYANAFMLDRASYSQLGSVLCVCGALAFYRAEIIHKNLDDFTNQIFLGKKAAVGDDRHLTNLALMDGAVVVVEDSIASTAAPARMGHYIRQQVRWGRSFLRESMWSLAHHTPKRVAWWLSLLEVIQWGAFIMLGLTVFVVYPLMLGHFPIVHYLIFTAMMGFVRGVRFLDLVRTNQTLWSRTLTFLTAPLYSFMNLFLLMPLKVWSLLTLGSMSWGTRSRVEVALGDENSYRTESK